MPLFKCVIYTYIYPCIQTHTYKLSHSRETENGVEVTWTLKEKTLPLFHQKISRNKTKEEMKKIPNISR